MRMLDLCCGRGGASKEFYRAGWEVVTVDINQKFRPTFTADINDFFIEGDFDLVWASPDCTEYSKVSLPATWKCNGGKHTPPDMRLFLNCYRIIRYLNPRWWVIENVRGAVPYFRLVLGEPVKYGSRYLWGVFPQIDPDRKKCFGKWRLPPTEDRAEIRSEIPSELSRALCLACEAEA